MHQHRHQVYLLLFFARLAVLRTVARQRTTVINLIYKCRAPVAFTRQVCNACTICCAWSEWCATLVLYVMLEMNGVQCLYYMLCLKRMVCNACNMCYIWNEWCTVLVICIAYTLVLRKILAHLLFMSLELMQNRLHAGFKSSLLWYDSTKTFILSQLIIPLSSSCCLPHHYPSFTRLFLVTVHLLADTTISC